MGRSKRASGRSEFALERSDRAFGRSEHALRRSEHALRRSEYALRRSEYALRRSELASERSEYALRRSARTPKQSAPAAVSCALRADGRIFRPRRRKISGRGRRAADGPLLPARIPPRAGRREWAGVVRVVPASSTVSDQTVPPTGRRPRKIDFGPPGRRCYNRRAAAGDKSSVASPGRGAIRGAWE